MGDRSFVWVSRLTLRLKATLDAPVVLNPPTEALVEILAAAQATLNEQLITLYTSLPERIAVVIFTGHSDPRRTAAFNAGKVAFESAIKRGGKAEDIDRSEWWSANDGRELEVVVEMAKRAFVGIE